MADERYIELILRQEEGLLTEAEASDLNEWLASDPDRLSLSHRLTQHYRSVDHAKHLEIDTQASFLELKGQLDKPSSQQGILKIRTSHLLKFAAAAVVLIAAGFFLYQTQSRGTQFLALEASSHSLSDESNVWLTKGSELIFKEGKDVRPPSLEGSAFFEVDGDPTRPFVVQAQNTQIRVLGTSFSVEEQTDALEVHVLEGLVSVTAPGASVELRPGEIASITASGILKRQQVEQPVAAWRTEALKFDDVDLPIALSQLVAYYPISIAISSPDLSRCRLNGQVGLDSLPVVLRTLESMLGATISKKPDGKYVVEGAGCPE